MQSNVVIAQDTWTANKPGSSLEPPPHKTDVCASIYRGEFGIYDPVTYIGEIPFQIGQEPLLLRYNGEQLAHPMIVPADFGWGLVDYSVTLPPSSPPASHNVFKYGSTTLAQDLADTSFLPIFSSTGTVTNLQDRLLAKMSILYQATTSNTIYMTPELFIRNVHSGFVYKSETIYNVFVSSVASTVVHPAVTTQVFANSTKPVVTLENNQIKIDPTLDPGLNIGIIDVYMCIFKQVDNDWNQATGADEVGSILYNGHTLGSWASSEARIALSEL